jgi:hypothetical protein
LNDNTREAFLNDARVQLSRLTIPRVGNAPDELERDPEQFIHSAIETLAAPESYLNLTPISSKNPAEVKLALSQLRDGLIYLKGVRNGTITPPSPVVLSPHGQVKVISKSDEPQLKQLPAGNVAAIGRVLFTDHLIAIELGGTLLLVATIGAILIAGHRREKTT